MRIFHVMLWVLVMTVPVFGQQIIHIENRRMADPQDGFSGSITSQINLVQNFSNTFETKNQAQIYWKSNQHQLMSVSALNLTIFEKQRIRNDGYQHLRYNFHLDPKWTPEVFVQYQYNEWLKLSFRALHGAGMRMTVLNSDSAKTKLFAGLSYMHEIELETTGKRFLGHRANLYFSVGLPVGKIVHIDAIGYFQPNLMWLKDIRSSLEATVLIHITNRLMLSLSYSIVYDGDPPEGMRNIFYDLKNGLRYAF